ncbi:MAG TPA: hypothetical protein VGY13_14595 [Solirubrobacteraceae bacterium]|jgi:hypothetical protein|nr:hypothetical protein [Solirubrobacteraceae bacterium]
MNVTVETELPIPAELACKLAQKPAMLLHVLWPWMGLTPLTPLPEQLVEGDEIVVRLRFFGLLPAWRHTVHVARLAPTEIVSREHGGPVSTWDHRLSFEPIGERSCRYTDSVEVRSGIATPLTWLYAQLIYRYRSRRWRTLARVLADPAAPAAR